MKFFFKYCFVILLLISLFICCNKKEEQIVGDWKYVFLSSIDTNKVQIWSFYEDKSLVKSLDSLKPDTGTWSMEASRLKGGRRLVISNLSSHNDGTDYNGTYEVLTLNDKYLILQRLKLSDGNSGGAFLRVEFIKKQ